MEHQEGRPQVKNLFARKITPNLQLVCWDKPSDPEALAYQVWASDTLNEKRPELSVMDERHIYVESFPDFGDGRHWLRVLHDLPAVSDSIFNVRAINHERHGDPATHTHFAADWKIVFDGQAIYKSRDPHKPRAALTAQSEHHSETIDLFEDPGMLEITRRCHGAIEEIAPQARSPYVRLYQMNAGSEIPIDDSKIRRTLDRKSGGCFRGSRQPPDAEHLSKVLQRLIHVPMVMMIGDHDGRISVTPYAEVVRKADRIGADGDIIGLTATISGDGMDPITARLTVIGQWIDDQGRHSVLASAEGQVASLLHAQALAADRRERGETGALV